MLNWLMGIPKVQLLLLLLVFVVVCFIRGGWIPPDHHVLLGVNDWETL